MGSCATCGKNAGVMRSECGDCERRRLEKEAEGRREDRKARVVQAEHQRDAWVDEQVARLRGRVRESGRASLFRSVYIPVNSIVDDKHLVDEFESDELRVR